MFILTSINVVEDIVKVFDTSDSSNDRVRLSKVLTKIRSGALKVRGLSLTRVFDDDWYCEQYSLFVSRRDAKVAMAEYFCAAKGMTREAALKQVGLM